MNTTKVTKVSENGTQTDYCIFKNKYDAKYNLITLCMQMHRNSNIMDNKEREKFESKIIEGKHSFFFEFGTDIFMVFKPMQLYTCVIRYDGITYLTRKYLNLNDAQEFLDELFIKKGILGEIRDSNGEKLYETIINH